VLTGDNQRTTAALAERLGVSYRANLLPEDKIAIVKEYQARGHTVVMVGDGVNDAPALADVGIAMGVAGTDIAIEAAHVAVMRDDWMLMPEVLQIAQQTMRVVKTNIAFTAVCNVIGLSLAAFGFLPLIFAAAAQSLPDLGILANSARLLRQKSYPNVATLGPAQGRWGTIFAPRSVPPTSQRSHYHPGTGALIIRASLVLDAQEPLRCRVPSGCRATKARSLVDPTGSHWNAIYKQPRVVILASV
jgi:hypothetical protein